MYRGHTAIRILTVLLAAAGFFSLALPLYPGGRQESRDGPRTAPAAAVREEPRQAVLFVVSAESRGIAMSTTLPGSEAAFHLFQGFRSGDGAVRVTTDRSFSMPIEERRYVEIDDTLGAVRYEVRLSPENPVTAEAVERMTVTFDAGALVSGSGRITQPARYAALQAVQESQRATGLVRVLDLRLSRRGRFTAEVEIGSSSGDSP